VIAKALDASFQRMVHPFGRSIGDRPTDRLDDVDNNHIDADTGGPGGASHRGFFPTDIPVLRFPVVTSAHERR